MSSHRSGAGLDDDADGVAAAEAVEAVVDAGEGQAGADELVELQPAFPVEAEDRRKINERPGAAVQLYDGKTALTISPRERRVLVLPAIELDSAKKLQTVVALQYRVEEKDNGLKSKFEIK